jgi:negative regulator of replication initiation
MNKHHFLKDDFFIQKKQKAINRFHILLGHIIKSNSQAFKQLSSMFH